METNMEDEMETEFVWGLSGTVANKMVRDS